MAEQKARHVIPKKHLYRAAFNWETWVQCCYNYERMMGMACGHTFVPVIDDLYKDDPDGAAKRKEVMEREMEFSTKDCVKSMPFPAKRSMLGDRKSVV